MAQHEIAHKITGGFEGGYVNDPDDAGGETIWGYARKKNPTAEVWKKVDEVKAKTPKGRWKQTLEADQTIKNMILGYIKKDYWDIMKLDSVGFQPIANELYDTAMNMGSGTAGLFLQRVLNVLNKNGTLYPDLKVDGQIGNVTITSLNKHPDQMNVLRLLNALQGAKYITICENNPSQEKYMNGWAKRVFEYNQPAQA